MNKKIIFVIGIIFFLFLAFASTVSKNYGENKRKVKKNQIETTFKQIEEDIQKEEFTEAQKKLEKIIELNSKNEKFIELHSYIFALNNETDFRIEALKLSKEELEKSKNAELYKRYTEYDEINKPLNKKINSYVKKNYKAMAKDKKDIEKYQKEEEKIGKIREFVNDYDDSYRPLVSYIKENMNDPKSYEHIQTGYNTEGEKMVTIVTRFRGKNKFGALVINQCEATAEIESGNLITVDCN